MRDETMALIEEPIELEEILKTQEHILELINDLYLYWQENEEKRSEREKEKISDNFERVIKMYETEKENFLPQIEKRVKLKLQCPEGKDNHQEEQNFAHRFLTRMIEECEEKGFNLDKNKNYAELKRYTENRIEKEYIHVLGKAFHDALEAPFEIRYKTPVAANFRSMPAISFPKYKIIDSLLHKNETAKQGAVENAVKEIEECKTKIMENNTIQQNQEK